MLIEVPNDVALRLQDMAAERGCTVGEVLRDWVGGEPSEQKYGTLADMVENAKAANLGTGKRVDTAARSREILKAEYPDFIRRRQSS